MDPSDGKLVGYQKYSSSQNVRKKTAHNEKLIKRNAFFKSKIMEMCKLLAPNFLGSMF